MPTGVYIRTAEQKLKISNTLKGRRIGRAANPVYGENHPNWRGDSVGYGALHDWVKARLGTPSLCFNCGSEDSKKYEWANISGNYKRDIDDFVRLCTLCHMKLDGTSIKERSINNTPLFYNRWGRKFEVKSLLA